jgi:hypothetical protein
MFFGGDPFGGGGFPGHSHGGGGGRRGGAPADTQKLYDVLGVSKGDDEKTISKAVCYQQSCFCLLRKMMHTFKHFHDDAYLRGTRVLSSRPTLFEFAPAHVSLTFSLSLPRYLMAQQYKKLAMKLHPDRGGDPAKFQEIQAASEILLDPKKRAYYDKVRGEALSRVPREEPLRVCIR